MSNPATPSYSALVARVQNSALVLAGVAWTFPTLVQPVHGSGWWFWASTGLAALTTLAGLASILETRFWRVPILSILLACVWRGGLRHLEETLLGRGQMDEQRHGVRNRENLQNALRTIVCFLAAAGVSVAAIVSS